MKLAHKVKYNGKWYLPGEEIVEAEESASLPFDGADAESYEPLPFENTFTKTDIKRMNVGDLKSLAAENGVPGYESMTGEQLKEYFINLLGL